MSLLCNIETKPKDAAMHAHIASKTLRSVAATKNLQNHFVSSAQ
jgi:hypothetical protein